MKSSEIYKSFVGSQVSKSHHLLTFLVLVAFHHDITRWRDDRLDRLKNHNADDVGWVSSVWGYLKSFQNGLSPLMTWKWPRWSWGEGCHYWRCSDSEMLVVVIHFGPTMTECMQDWSCALYTTIWVSSSLYGCFLYPWCIHEVSMKHPYPTFSFIGALRNCIPNMSQKTPETMCLPFLVPGWGQIVEAPATCQACSKCRPPRERSEERLRWTLPRYPARK